MFDFPKKKIDVKKMKYYEKITNHRKWYIIVRKCWNVAPYEV